MVVSFGLSPRLLLAGRIRVMWRPHLLWKIVLLIFFTFMSIAQPPRRCMSHGQQPLQHDTYDSHPSELEFLSLRSFTTVISVSNLSTIFISSTILNAVDTIAFTPMPRHTHGRVGVKVNYISTPILRYTNRTRQMRLLSIHHWLCIVIWYDSIQNLLGFRRLTQCAVILSRML